MNLKIKPIFILLTAVLVLTVSVVSAQDAATMFNKGVQEEQNGNLDAALSSYLACIKMDPNYVDGYINAGTIQFKKKDYEAALNLFKTATEKDAKSKDAFSNLGKVNYIMKRYAEAEAALKTAISIDSKDAELYKDLGKVYYKKKNYQDVIDTFNKCHELNGGDFLTYYMLGKAYQKKDDMNNAIAALKQSASLNGNYNAYSTLGSIYLSQEKYQSAAGAFSSAMKADPKKYRAAYNFAIAVENSDPENYTKNIANWEKFISLAKNNPKSKDDVNIAKEHVAELKKAQEQASLQ